jgi:hypothetical protein
MIQTTTTTTTTTSCCPRYSPNNPLPEGLECRRGDTTDSKAAMEKDAILKDLAGNTNNKNYIDNRDDDGDDGSILLCTDFWQQHIDCQPLAWRLNIGVCASQAPFVNGFIFYVRETGDDASYAEGWLLLAGSHRETANHGLGITVAISSRLLGSNNGE